MGSPVSGQTAHQLSANSKQGHAYGSGRKKANLTNQHRRVNTKDSPAGALLWRRTERHERQPNSLLSIYFVSRDSLLVVLVVESPSAKRLLV